MLTGALAEARMKDQDEKYEIGTNWLFGGTLVLTPLQRPGKETSLLGLEGALLLGSQKLYCLKRLQPLSRA